MNSPAAPPPDAGTALPSAPLDPTDREKFEFDKKVRLEELDLKKAENLRLGDELKLKQQELQRSRWANPLIVAIIGAIAIGFGNLAVSRFNAKAARDLSDSTNANQGYLESVRSENTSVLEVVKLADAEKVRNGLCLLLKLNSVKSDTTHAAIQSYLVAHKGCDPAPGTVSTDPTANPPNRSDWINAQLVVPGCGNSGCYENFRVCGSAPGNTKPTGNIRNSVDSFGGAWGDWSGAPEVSASQVCRTFTQHSHNVTRTVSYQFEVVPTS
jgi:hypothetical protein